MIQKIFYRLLKNYCQVALWFYFKKWQIHQRAPIPDGPVIFVPNHQNAFLDAVLVACSSKRNPWFLTRANVFDKPWAKKILTLLQMSPVYRFRDGFNTLRKNDIVVENCVNLLQAKQCVLIFGEGNHNDQWQLRSLQKGFARIATAAEEKNDWQLGVSIIPVGIQYDSHTDFRSRVLINFGKPILIKDLWDKHVSFQENLEIIVNNTYQALKPLILHIPSEHYEARVAYLKSHRVTKNALVEQLKSDQALVDSVVMSESHSAKASSSKKWSLIFLYQYLNHFLPHSIIQWVLKNKVADPQFTGSIKFALGLVLVPVFYFVQTGICYAVSGSPLISSLYLLSLPVSVLLRR